MVFCFRITNGYVFEYRIFNVRKGGLSLATTYWGVDSAAIANEDLYQCVVANFGTPKFWGRYLVTVPNAAEGLSATEITFLRRRGIKILPIYSAFREATGYTRGQIQARNAIFHARRLGIPKDVVLFANVERFFAVDEAWIRGWVDEMYPSGYRPGFYFDPVEGSFSNAYCAAAAKSERVKQQAFLWSAEPEPGETSNKDTLAFKPAQPHCGGNVWGWQYGRDADACPIDTNLITQQLYQHLW